MPFSRRRFLGFAAGAAAGAVAGRKGGQVLAGMAIRMDRPIYPPGGEETMRLSICRECPGGCGTRVRRIGDRAVKIDGNPLHPVSGGRLCPLGQAALQSLYHPDRIRQPLRRVGPRGALSSFTPATWEEALEQTAVRLSLLRQQGRPESLVLLRGSANGVDGRLASRFLSAFGSPNDLVLNQGGAAATQALQLTQGIAAEPAYDLAGAEYLLSIGSSILEASASPVYMMRAFGEFRRGRYGRRGRFVHVGPRQSITAAAADEWVPVRPGTEGVFALGLASAMIGEDLYDKEFVALRANGFEDFQETDGRSAQGLRHFLGREFSLERVAAECGVPVNRILRLAREFAAARPALAVGPRGGLTISGDLFGHLAAGVLNGLVGSVDGPGGMLVAESLPSSAWPEIHMEQGSAEGRGRPRLDRGRGPVTSYGDPERLAAAILEGDPYAAEAVLVLDCDPIFASASPGSLGAALEHVPLVVTITGVPNETSLVSDWILPAAHAMERWDLDLGPQGMPYPVASLARPVLDSPAAESRPAGEVLLDLASRIGGEVKAALPWDSLQKAIRAEIHGIFAARRGAIMGTRFDEAWVRLMERAGWWAPGYRTEEELWKKMQETGGWWDPFYDHWDWRRVLRTGSGRFEFRPDVLARIDQERRSRQLVWSRPGTPPAEAPEEGLALHLFEPLALAGGAGASLPFLQEILDPGHEERWETWIEINPETAAELGIEDGETINVAHALTTIRGRARVTERVVPGTAAIPIGQGRAAGGRWAERRGSNPLQLVAPVREAVSGLPDPGAIRVRLEVAAADSVAAEQEEA